MSNRGWCALVFATVVALSTGVGSAQEPEESLEEEQARAHFQAGSLAFSRGRFEDALVEFEKAHALSQRPKLLYNIAVAADRLRRDERALEAFQLYLQQVPDAAERAEVEARIVVLRDAVQRASAERATRETTAAPPRVDSSAPDGNEATAPQVDVTPTRASHSNTAPLALMIGGGAIAVTGGVLLGLALADKGAVESPDDGVRLEDIEGAHDRVPLFSGLGATLLGVGVVATGIGVIWLVTSAPEAAPTTEPALAASIGLGSMSIRGRF